MELINLVIRMTKGEKLQQYINKETQKNKSKI